MRRVCTVCVCVRVMETERWPRERGKEGREGRIYLVEHVRLGIPCRDLVSNLVSGVTRPGVGVGPWWQTSLAKRRDLVEHVRGVCLPLGVVCHPSRVRPDVPRQGVQLLETRDGLIRRGFPQGRLLPRPVEDGGDRDVVGGGLAVPQRGLAQPPCNVLPVPEATASERASERACVGCMVGGQAIRAIKSNQMGVCLEEWRWLCRLLRTPATNTATEQAMPPPAC